MVGARAPGGLVQRDPAVARRHHVVVVHRGQR
jgi:hypothetical protein